MVPRARVSRRDLRATRLRIPEYMVFDPCASMDIEYCQHPLALQVGQVTPISGEGDTETAETGKSSHQGSLFKEDVNWWHGPELSRSGASGAEREAAKARKRSWIMTILIIIFLASCTLESIRNV